MAFTMIHENYNVSNLDVSISFYEKALGLHEVRRKNAADGSFVIVYMADDTETFELELTWLRDHPQKYDLGECEFHLAFRTDDFAAAHEKHSRWAASVLKTKRWASISSKIPTAIGWKLSPLADPDPPSCNAFQRHCSHNSEHSIM